MTLDLDHYSQSATFYTCTRYIFFSFVLAQHVGWGLQKYSWMDSCGVQTMEEDRAGRIVSRAVSPKIVSLVTGHQAAANSTGKSNPSAKIDMELSSDHSGALDGAASGLDETEPLLSVTQRIKKKREGEWRWRLDTQRLITSCLS